MTFCYINDYDIDVEESLMLHIRAESDRVSSDEHKKMVIDKMNADSARLLASLKRKFKKSDEDEENE